MPVLAGNRPMSAALARTRKPPWAIASRPCTTLARCVSVRRCPAPAWAMGQSAWTVRPVPRMTANES